MFSLVEAEAVSGGLRSSPTLQVTVIVPGCAPRLSWVAVAVLPVIFRRCAVAVGQPAAIGTVGLRADG